jgi:hypothetical protein
MTPKEKAEELISVLCLNDCTDKNIKKCKKLAIMSVNKILKKVKLYTTYWQEVKQEIEKL